MAIQTSRFTQVDVTNFTAISTVGAATFNGQQGTVTTEALSTAVGATYTFTLTNASIAAASNVYVSVGKGTATTGNPVVTWVTPAAGTCVVIIQNINATLALNGTLTLSFFVTNLV